MLVGIGMLAGLQAAAQINTVTSGVPFLRISPDARSTGMGETGIATLPDAYSGFWNNGKTPFNAANTAVGLTYTPWLSDLDLKDVYIATLGAYHKLDDMQAVNLGFRYFSLGDIQFTDVNGTLLSQGRPREWAVDLGYSRKLSDQLGLGLSLRYVSSDLANGNFNGVVYKKGSSVAGDLHLYSNGNSEDGVSGLKWGVTLSNLGSKISYTEDQNKRDYVPANLGVGAAYTKLFDADNKITFALDLNKRLVPTPPDLNDPNAINDYYTKGVVSSWFSSFGDAPGGAKEELKEVTASIGGEYTYKDAFSFRAGYFYESPEKGNRKYVTVGAGLNYNMFGLNISYIVASGSGITRNPLSNTVRFGVNFNLDGAAAATATPAL